MKPQEAIGIMKIALAEVEWEYPMDYAAAFEMAIEALEKQVPKKPIMDNELGFFQCSTCGGAISYIEDPTDHKYCLLCDKEDWMQLLKRLKEQKGKENEI